MRCKFTWYAPGYQGFVQCKNLVEAHGDNHEHGQSWVAVGHEEVARHSHWDGK